MRAWALLALAGLALAAPGFSAAEALPPLLESQVYYTQDMGQAADTTMLAPQVVLVGSDVDIVGGIATPEACADLCRTTPDCTWFNYCGAAGGCADGGEPLAPDDCQLLAPNSTAVPLVRAAGLAVAATAGFPWPLSSPLETFPGFTTVLAQGFQGEADYSCPGSALPDRCAFRTVSEAAMLCSTSLSCRTIVVFSRGLDGASDLLAVLKSANLPPLTTLVSPLTYSITRLSAEPAPVEHLYNSDGDTVLPTPEELAANSSWKGCFLGRNAAVDGLVVATVAAPTAEACCRACASWGSGSGAFAAILPTGQPTSCNVWNYCGQPGGCRLVAADGMALELAQGQCQLRFQALVQPSIAFPAALIAKGPNVTFQAGGPIVTAGPPIDGYTLLPGRGLFTFGRFNCTGSLRPEIQECVRQGTPDELAGDCNDDPKCVAFVLKQQGVNGAASNLGIFKHNASASAILWNPTGLLYLRDNPPSSSSLSAGAIAGIVVGAVVGAAALAGGAWWLVRRRRQRRLHEQRGKSGGVPGGTGDTDAELAKLEAGASPAAAASAGAAAAAAAAAAGSAATASDDSPPRSGSAAPAASAGTARTQSMSPQQSAAPGDLPPLAELQALVRAHDAALATVAQPGGGGGSAGAPLPPLLAAQLPASLREFVVPPDAFQYCRLPNGQLHELGSGASGKVYKAVLNGEFVAAKEIDIGGSSELQAAFVREAVRLHQLRHAAVVGFVGVSLAGGAGVLLCELCEGRDLYGALGLAAAGTRQRLFGWHRLGRRVALDVARALNYLHSRGVVHLDVKSSNVLLTASGAAKLGDVGVSMIQTKTYLTGVSAAAGTYAWTAPEVLLGQRCTAAVDIFSFGVVLWEICTGEHPTRGRLRAPLVPEECPQEAADLIAACTSADPAARPTAQQAMERLRSLVRGPRAACASVDSARISLDV